MFQDKYKKERLLFFTSSITGGGAQMQLIRLFDISKDYFIHTSFYVAKGRGIENQIYSFNKKRTIFSIFDLIFKIKNDQITTLVSTLPTPNLINVLLKKFKLSNHTSIVRIAHYNLNLKITKLIVKNADIILFNSRENLKKYSEKYPEFIEKFYYLNNIVKQNSILENSNEENKIKKGLVASSLVRRKGIDLLVKAMNEITNPLLKIDVYGVGPEYSNLVSKSKNKNLNFLNINVNLEQIWNKYDFFILPSRSEGLSNSLLEAQQNNLFSIVSDCLTGNKEIINLTKNGVIFESGNYVALKEKLINLSNEKYININSQKIILEEFSSQKALGTFLKLFSI